MSGKTKPFSYRTGNGGRAAGYRLCMSPVSCTEAGRLRNVSYLPEREVTLHRGGVFAQGGHAERSRFMENGTDFGKRKGESFISRGRRQKHVSETVRGRASRNGLPEARRLCRELAVREVFFPKRPEEKERRSPARYKKSPANLAACGALNGEADGT